MKKRCLILNSSVILIISLLSIFLISISVSAEEFKSCSQNSDCKVDICNENSCVNQSYQIPQCISPTLLAKECYCLNNICSVLVGSSVPVCDTNHPDVTYCKDEKTMMVCSGGNWVSKDCVYKCQGVSCIAGCYKNEDCGSSYIKKYCSNNEVCLATVTPVCLNSICSSNSATSCTPCKLGCSEGRCLEETTTPTIVPASCQSIKCQDGTISTCKLVDNQCICSTCPVISQPVQCTDSDNGNFYEKGIMKGAVDDAGHWDLCGDYNTLTEYYCENNEARKTPFNCPNGCKDGACIKGESISEKVICGFANSNQEQKCYTAEQNSRAYCSGIGSCVTEIKGQRGEKITWKSSCGQYQYTIIDGNDEKIGFDCTSGETNIAQIENKGFKHTYFQCYDGEESKSTEREACKTAEFWKKFAENFCQSHCSKNGGIEKCGVNSFSLVDECYFEGETAIPAVSIPSSENAETIIPKQGMLYYFNGDNCPGCQEIDKEIGILKQKGFFNNFGAAVFSINNKEIADKYEIKVVPSFILYKDGCSFRKEGFMKSEEIETWVYGAKCEESIEPILVCKDSCPLDEKCYPFGYRKSGKFCSDNGGFTEQLKGESTCDNNFECSSNVCVSGNCISEGLIQKILNLFKRMFGG